jgi:4-amino-4-deoxy-L-arabinose transferase-like glycosyltransferase
MNDALPSSDSRSAQPRADRLRSVVDWWRSQPLEAILVGLGLFALLATFVAADPTSKVTFSSSPFTDEAFNTVNARNVVQLGRWSTDEWNLYLVNLPFSLLQAAWFGLVGVGIVQARLIAIACVSLTAAALIWDLRGVVDRASAVFAGLAFAASGLVLVYGRLAFLEDMVVLGLVLGTAVLARDDRLTWRWGALSGAWYAVAIGAKPSAGFAVAGILIAVAATLAWRDRAARRWAAGALAIIAMSGLVWAMVIWLPNRDAVAMDLRIWATENLSLAPGDMARSAWGYVTGENDHLYGTMLGPLLALGAAGLAAVALLRGRLSRAQARLASVSIGWLALGFGILLIASYRPNRYVLPLVPPLAILAALGLHVGRQWLRDALSGRAADAPDQPATPPDRASGGLGRARRTRLLAERWAVPALVVAVTVAAIAPGLAWYASWARQATYNLPAIQDRFASAVPAGESVAGRESALYLMKSRAITLITQPGGGPANGGDLYTRGVLWYLLPVDDPAPPGVSDTVWSARQKVLCADYGGATECLFHVP